MQLRLALAVAILASLGAGQALAGERVGSMTITNKSTGHSRTVIVEQSASSQTVPQGVTNGAYTQEQVRMFTEVFGKLPPNAKTVTR